MARLVALRMFNYPSGTRTRLNPGDVFDASRDANVLVATGLARLADAPKPALKAPQPTYETRDVVANPGLTSLRQQYEFAAGRAPDMRWGTDRLRREIDALTYQRRDMRAED